MHGRPEEDHAGRAHDSRLLLLLIGPDIKTDDIVQEYAHMKAEEKAKLEGKAAH